MKKFLVILMAMGLMMAVALPAAAVDVKFSGSWYMAGWYSDNHSLLDKGTLAANDPSWGALGGGQQLNRGATALYTHKLRLMTTFQVVEGLKLNTMIDVLEGVMGDSSWSGGGLFRQSQPTSTRTNRYTNLGAGNNAESAPIQENIEFELANVEFNVPFGRIWAGYLNEGLGLGTMFLNHPYTYPGIKFFTAQGPLSVVAEVRKIREWRNRNNYGTGLSMNNIKNDSDSDAYMVAGIYKTKFGEVGLQYELWRDSRAKSAQGSAVVTGLTDGTALVPVGNQGWVTMISTINPWIKGKFGIAYVEAEGYYRFGKLRKYETFTAGNAQESDVDVSAWGGYIKAQADLKPFFVGAQFIYMSGDEMQSKDKVTGSIAQAYGDNYVTPSGTLVLWNFDYLDAMGPMYGNVPLGGGAGGTNPRTNSSWQNQRYMDNVWFYQIYAGMNITPKLNVTAKLAYATADKKPKLGIGSVGDALNASNSGLTAAAIAAYAAAYGAGNKEFTSDKYGTEIDLIANYKIYDNLTYTIGGGYLFVGDYFKGYDVNAKLKDNYILTHKLTLNF
jgi:hypothetical protein